jgi:hypothetical protein
MLKPAHYGDFDDLDDARVHDLFPSFPPFSALLLPSHDL